MGKRLIKPAWKETLKFLSEELREENNKHISDLFDLIIENYCSQKEKYHSHEYNPYLSDLCFAAECIGASNHFKQRQVVVSELVDYSKKESFKLNCLHVFDAMSYTKGKEVVERLDAMLYEADWLTPDITNSLRMIKTEEAVSSLIKFMQSNSSGYLNAALQLCWINNSNHKDIKVTEVLQDCMKKNDELGRHIKVWINNEGPHGSGREIIRGGSLKGRYPENDLSVEELAAELRSYIESDDGGTAGMISNILYQLADQSLEEDKQLLEPILGSFLENPPEKLSAWMEDLGRCNPPFECLNSRICRIFGKIGDSSTVAFLQKLLRTSHFRDYVHTAIEEIHQRHTPTTY